MLFDTNILIWVERGNEKAAHVVSSSDERYISIQTYMELLQGATNRKQAEILKSFLSEHDFQILPFTENIGHRASIYIEEYAIPSGVRVGDAIIAATATENNLILATGNHKHFKPIKDLKVHLFRP